MQTLTKEQIALFEKLEKEGVSQDAGFEDITEEQCDMYIEKYLKVTASSPGGLFPNCAVSGGSCSGC